MSTPDATPDAEAPAVEEVGKRVSFPTQNLMETMPLHGREAQPEDDPNRLVATEYHSDDNMVPVAEGGGDTITSNNANLIPPEVVPQDEEDNGNININTTTGTSTTSILKGNSNIHQSKEALDESALDPPKLVFHSSEFRMEKALNEDIYSVMYTAKLKSVPFYFAVFTFLVQFSILVLIFIDLVDTTEDPPTTSNGETNRLKIPVDVERTVRIAQFCGVILIVNFTAAGGDMIKGCDRLFNEYDEELLKEHPGATRFKWVLSSILQASSGFFMIMNLFILLMQSTTVVGLCLNFAALHFVQDIDDVAFTVAEMGLCGQVIKDEVKGVGEIMTSAAMKKRTLWMRRILLSTIVVTLYTCFFVFTSWQWAGKYACNALLIQFGDAYDPDLAHFSGVFYALGSQSSRIKYVDPSGTYKLRYSRSNKAWVLEPNTADKGLVVIKSSETDTFDVTSMADQVWFHNITTAGFVPVDWFALRCHECNDARCPPDRGTCNERHECVCHQQYIGESCEADAPKCLWYAIDFRTRGTLGNIPGGSFFFDNNFLGLNTFRIYGRYLYVPFDFNSVSVARVQNFIFFTGRRWIVMGAPFKSSSPTLEEFIQPLNNSNISEVAPIRAIEALSSNRNYKPLFYSSPVDLGTPSYGYDPSAVTWVFAKKNKESQFFGYAPDDDDTISAQFLCSECSNTTEGLDDLATCRNGGRCGNLGFCECTPFFTGYQCEYVYNCNELGCFNGGICDPITGACHYCHPDAYGNICQNPPPPKVKENPYFCSSTLPWLSSCQNRQQCDPFELKCNCEPPFYGEFCQNSTQESCVRVAEFDIEEAGIVAGDTIDPCLNGGFCDFSYFHYPICRCTEGFTGDFCQTTTALANGPTRSPTKRDTNSSIHARRRAAGNDPLHETSWINPNWN